MVKISASTKEELKAYFKRTSAPVDETEKERVVRIFSKVASESSVTGPERVMPMWRFVIGQLRFVNPLAWMAQMALLAAMLFLVNAYGKTESAMLIVMATAVLSVTIAMPSVFKSFENNVAELEASCQHDAAHVLVSRFVLFGLADVLWMSLAAWLVPTIAGDGPFRVFLYAATPFFAFCALSFHLSRITNGRCVKPCAVAASVAILLIWESNEKLPHWYSDASMVVWSLALLAALTLAAYEARKLVVQLASDNVSQSTTQFQF